jgi:hypothetical protein
MPLPPSQPAAPQRVTNAFAQFAQSIAAKERIAVPELDYHIAASAALPDGAVATLWVATAQSARSRCYHVDVTSDAGHSATGTGACAQPDGRVSLNRAGSLVVGSVGSNPATSVRVTTPHGTVTLPVTAGYFLVPPDLTVDPDTSHHLALLDSTGSVTAEAAELTAPGSIVPSR